MKLLLFSLFSILICSCNIKRQTSFSGIDETGKLEFRIERKGQQLRVVRFYRAPDGREIKHGPTSVFHLPNKQGDSELYEHGKLVRKSKNSSFMNF